MKTITKVKLIVLTLITLTVFIGCGGGSDASFSDVEDTQTIASCSGDISTWTTVSSGDTVVADSSSQVKFDHDSNGTKKVCVVIGTATLTKAQ